MCRRLVAVLPFSSSPALPDGSARTTSLCCCGPVTSRRTLVPLCARAAGINVQAEYANNPAVAKDIIDGARFDTVVAETRMLDDLAKGNLVARPATWTICGRWSSASRIGAFRYGSIKRILPSPAKTLGCRICF
jgi:hypothetical protein